MFVSTRSLSTCYVVFGLASFSMMSTGANGQVTIDGVRDSQYGSAVAVQTVQTDAGDNMNEWNAAYANVYNDRLNLMFTGNLQVTGAIGTGMYNKLDIFFDTVAGGENTLSSTPVYDWPDNSSPNMGGLTFDTGFEADYHLYARGGIPFPAFPREFVVDFVNRNGGTSSSVPWNAKSVAYDDITETAAGVVNSSDIGFGASGSAIVDPIVFGMDNSNTLGITGGTGAADTAAALAVDTGFEVSIALTDLGLDLTQANTIRIALLQTTVMHDYLFNQTLGGLPAGTSSPGGDGVGGFTGTLSGINFNNFAGNQFFELNIPARTLTLSDEFGSGSNTFNIEFVTICNPGNPADTSGAPNPAGSVAYNYRMGKYEISEDMIDKANAEGGLGITKDTRGPNKPATSVSWNEAARFVNWLNTSTGNPAAYKFEFQPGDAGYDSNANIQLWDPGDAGYDPNNLFRNSLAKYVLPSMDEWYKAAYYDPTAGTYFDYPTGSDTAPTAVAVGTTADTAVYDQPFAQGPADISQAGGLSPYGTMGQGGNVWEWEESEFDLVNDSNSAGRGLRGGYWSSPSNQGVLLSSARLFNNPTTSGGIFGFRVAGSSSLGDANDDGVVNNLDITAFGLALFQPTVYAAMYPGVNPDVDLDMNCDGSFNNLDIAAFGSALGL